MIDLIENRNGLWWPKNEKTCYRHTQSQLDVPEHIMKYVSKFNTIVQAGGNAGWYTQIYGEHFEQVFVLEPDYLNFLCLTLNNPARHVIKMQACLGHQHSQVELSIVETNRGANFISTTDSNEAVSVPVILIDDLSLKGCDLIHLDIEGYEYFALLGASNTIKKYSPVIAFEHNGAFSRYGLNESNIFNLLDEYGYQRLGTYRDELIYGKV